MSRESMTNNNEQKNNDFMGAQASIRRYAEQQADCVMQLAIWAKKMGENESHASRNEEKARQQKEGARYCYATPIGACTSDETCNHNHSTNAEKTNYDVELVSSSEDNGNAELDEQKRGNDFYNKGNFQQAETCYTQCLVLNPQSEIAYSNRAMTYLKLKEWSHAEDDANSSLQINPWNVKSLVRRSTARASLGKLRAALQDLYLAEIAHIYATSEEKAPNAITMEQRKIQKLLRDALHRAPKRSVAISLARNSNDAC